MDLQLVSRSVLLSVLALAGMGSARPGIPEKPGSWGGVSNTPAVDSFVPSLALDASGNPVVAWEEKDTAGIVPVSFDIRGQGSSFSFDPRHSSTFSKNLMVIDASPARIVP